MSGTIVRRVVVIVVAGVLGGGLGGAGASGQFVDRGKNATELQGTGSVVNGAVDGSLLKGELIEGQVDRREELARELMRLKADRAEMTAGARGGNAETASLDKALLDIRRQLAQLPQTAEQPDQNGTMGSRLSGPDIPLFPRIVPIRPMEETPKAGDAAEQEAGVAGRAGSAARGKDPGEAEPGAAADPDAGAGFAGESAADRPVLRAMTERLVSVAANKAKVAEILESIRTQAKINMYINWKVLEAAGIDRDTPVSIVLNQVVAGKALKAVLQEVGGGTANIDYTIHEGIVAVSSRDDLNSTKYVIGRVYNVLDLLAIPQGVYVLPQMAAQIQENRSENLQDTIKAMVAPDSWRDTGGTVGSMRELNGNLVINQTADNHREIRRLLAELRSQPGY